MVSGVDLSCRMARRAPVPVHSPPPARRRAQARRRAAVETGEGGVETADAAEAGTSPTDKQIVLNAWQTFRTRDANLIAAVFAPDAEWIAPARNATAVALDHTDHMISAEAIARFISTEMHRLFSEIDIAFRAVHADGNSGVIGA